jgi:hypothetical protein
LLARRVTGLEQLEREFRQVLAELEILSHGSTQSWSPTRGGSDEGYGRPPGDLHPPHVHWRWEWEHAKDDKRRKEVLERAREELVSHRRRDMKIAAPVDLSEDLEVRVIREGEGWTVQETALHCRCTPTFVRRARLKAGVNAQTGAKPKDAPDLETSEERCRRLDGEGMSERQIALATRLPKSTVRRLLGRAA